MKKYKCQNCGEDKFHIDKDTLERGDKPTVAQCIKCGYELYV